MQFAQAVRFVLIGGLLLGLIGCSSSSTESTDAQTVTAAQSPTAPSAAETSTDEARGSITPENIIEYEQYWPNITALTEAWLPPDSDEPLKKGWRGALIRVDLEGRARIAFGRHGNHDIPIEYTDLIARANQVESGRLHKVAPNFIAHFGTQFVHPSTETMLPFPTTELTRAESFLCVFTDPRDPGFEALARQLTALQSDRPSLQMLLFPLSMRRDDLPVVRQRLKAVSWLVPFAYPQAAEVHARSLLGTIPTAPYALVITPEGRLLQRSNLDGAGAIDSIRAAVKSTPTDSTPDSPTPDTKAG